MRLYYLGDGNVLHEAYLMSSHAQKKCVWHLGDLHKLKIVLDPTSSIAAFRDGSSISVFYQGRCHDPLQRIHEMTVLE